MKITSVRTGFATNSSSSHSVISGSNLMSEMTNEEIAEKYNAGGNAEFGWVFDSYSDSDSIVNYALMLFIPGADELDPYDNEYSYELKSILEKFQTHSFPYIDHQSIEGYGYGEVQNSNSKEAEESFWDFVRNVGEIQTGNDNV